MFFLMDATLGDGFEGVQVEEGGEKYFRKNQKNETYSNPLKTASWCLVSGCVHANIGFDLG
jgi:hypothetical protein